MIRKVMVLAIACLIVNSTGSGAVTAGSEVFDAIGGLKSSSGLRRRRSPEKLGK